MSKKLLAALGATPPSEPQAESTGLHHPYPEAHVEVPLDNGLDVLAAFSDGGVRYLNQSGKIAVVEADDTPLAGLAKELIAASRPIVEKIGPWEEQRLPPPKAGNVRITFLVSDGLYFGEGPYAVLQADDMAGPVLAKAAQLLQEVVDTLVD